MRKLKYIIALSLNFCVCSIVFSQEEIMNEEWFLQKMVIDEQDVFPPENAEFEYVSMHFEYEDLYFFSSEVCSSVDGMMNYVTDSGFSFFDIGCCGIGTMCTEPENAGFENQYIYFYVNYFESDFPYIITFNSDESKTLTVTNQSGNKAIYSNQQMSVEDSQQLRLNFHPNPVKNKLTVENPDLKITSIKVSDSSGKMVIQQTISEKQAEIDFRHLPSGIYFVSFEENDKILKTEKVVKK